VTGVSANVGQVIVIVLLAALVALHIATTIYSVRAAQSAAESANNTKNQGQSQRGPGLSGQPGQPVRADTRSGQPLERWKDPGACATACGEACTGSDDVPILETCARRCAAACGFDFA
jgi:hypothetical protein